MVDLFSFIRLHDGETVQHIHRSHVLRLVLPLCGIALMLLLPWFFLFDYRGWQWLFVVLWWMTGIAALWYVFDVWSTSLVVETSQRWIAARRERWGRVRVSEWTRDRVSGPVWHKTRWGRFGAWVWTTVSDEASSDVAMRLSWIWRPSVDEAPQGPSLKERRKALLQKVAKVETLDQLESLERVFDESASS